MKPTQKQISNGLRIIAGLSLIIMGWKQEIFYYVFTFNAIGIGETISKITAFSLCVLLCYFAYYKKTAKFRIVLSFSIVCTLLGQAQSYTVKKESYNIDTQLYTNLTLQKDRYTLEIERINKKIDDNTALLPKDLQGRAMWKTNGVDPIKSENKELESDKKEYEVLLDEVINKLSTGTGTTTLFENIAKDIPFISAKVLQYAFMIPMSLLISLMAPAGISLWQSVFSTTTPQPKKKPKKEGRAIEKVSDKTDNESIYTKCRFEGAEDSGVLKSRKYTVENTALSYSECNALSRLAEKLGILSVQGNKSVPLVNKVQFEMMLRNRQSVELRSVR